MSPGNERGNELGARRAEQFPHIGNYTLTPGAPGVFDFPSILATCTVGGR